MTNWWSADRAAADDADVDREWLDDFEFDDDADVDHIGGIWSRYSTRSADDAVRIASTLKLMQGFVDTFATGDKPYRVTFDENVGTAGTDFKSRSVVISHAPLFDKTITAELAERVLTAMAAHESSHVRYDREHHKAVAAAFPLDPRALRVNNVIGDVRIERRFSDDFPGYANIFDPAIEYVAKSQLAKIGADVFDAKRLDPIGVVTGALRYGRFVDWTGRESEREWWQAWAARWTKNDRTADRVEAIREALAKLDEPQPEQPEQQSDDTEVETSDEQSDEQSQSSEQQSGGVADEQPDAPQNGRSDEQSDEAEDQSTSSESEQQPGEQSDESEQTQDASAGGDWTSEISLPECFADAIADAAEQNDEDAAKTNSAEAQTLAEQAKAIVKVGDEYGEVYWGPGGIAKGRKQIAADGSASSAIRAAFARSRSGHSSTQRSLKSGRIDNRSLTRVASNDYRLFQKRTAQGEGKYNVWTLVDCSGSMQGYPIMQAASVAMSLASASRSVPNMRLSIFGWTSSWRFSGAFGAVRVWTQGDPLVNVGYLPRVPMGGTPDAETLTWAIDAIIAESRPGETPVILLASDGSGTMHDSSVVDAGRAKGVEIVSVAIGYLRTQESIFGKNGFLQWQGSIRAMARPLGKLLARVVSGGSLD